MGYDDFWSETQLTRSYVLEPNRVIGYLLKTYYRYVGFNVMKNTKGKIKNYLSLFNRV